MNCELCGQRVTVYSTGEGTNSYVGVDAAELEKYKSIAAEIAEACSKFNHDILHKYIRIVGGGRSVVEFNEEEFLKARGAFLDALTKYRQLTTPDSNKGKDNGNP